MYGAMPERSEPRLLTTIQGARGIAAVMVVLAHAGTILGFSEYLRYIPLHGAFQPGHAGVDFFFVLSGFIIATVHGGDIGRQQALRAYVCKRLIRIYPPLWAAMAIAVAIALLGGSAAISVGLHRLSVAHLLLDSMLLPRHQEPLLGVAWTLEHEMVFYFVFALLIWNRSVGAAAMLAWLAWSVFATATYPSDRLPWASADLLSGFLGSSYHLQFGAGMAAAVLVARDRVPAPRTLIALGAAGFILTATAENAGDLGSLSQIERLLFGASAALVVAGLAMAERRGIMRLGRLPVLLGGASYSIYLVHVPVMIALAGGLTIAWLPGWCAMLLLAVGGIVSGLVFHVLVERPGLIALRRWLRAPMALDGYRAEQLNGRYRITARVRCVTPTAPVATFPRPASGKSARDRA
jgi:peptidoglycan/LPS O-acetylase OafA/YrhL